MLCRSYDVIEILVATLFRFKIYLPLCRINANSITATNFIVAILCVVRAPSIAPNVMLFCAVCTRGRLLCRSESRVSYSRSLSFGVGTSNIASKPEKNDAWIKWPQFCRWHFQHIHGDVIKEKQFPRYCPFVRGIQRSRWIPRTKASDAEFSLICVRINDWVNSRKAGDLRRHRGHHDVSVMFSWQEYVVLGFKFRF